MVDLLERTAALVDIASVSRDERAIADALEPGLRAAPHLEVVRIGDNLVARTDTGAPRRLVLAGHLDTVPAAGNERARREADRCYGLGAADMKGGIAVMADLATAVVPSGLDVTYVFYVCEEIARAHSGLLAIEAVRPELLLGDAAVLLEPTAAVVEAGCQGIIRVHVHIGGRRAHSARPWVGTNAIHRSSALLALLARYGEAHVVIDGCEYRESVQAVAINGGVAGNVVPDEVVVRVSHRFAPNRSVETAYAELEAVLLEVLEAREGDWIELEDSAPAAPPSLAHPLLAQLVDATAAPPAAKLGWTDVAFFFERGIPALNYGPGDGLLAHSPDEFVSRDELERVRAVLGAVLGA